MNKYHFLMVQTIYWIKINGHTQMIITSKQLFICQMEIFKTKRFWCCSVKETAKMIILNTFCFHRNCNIFNRDSRKWIQHQIMTFFLLASWMFKININYIVFLLWKKSAHSWESTDIELNFCFQNRNGTVWPLTLCKYLSIFSNFSLFGTSFDFKQTFLV